MNIAQDNLQQLREFLSVYNILTEKCFASCIRDYNSHKLTDAEDTCVSRCNMTRFAGVERRQRVRADRKSMEIERLIQKTFEGAVLTHLFPTSQIDIYCQIIQSDGSHLAACVNAASLAMSDAGIPMKGLVAAATCSIVDGQPVVDVNQREETDILPRLTLATLRGEDEVVLVELQNRVHVDHLPALLAAAKDTCKGVHECICAAIVDQLENRAFFLR
ncbi:3' exoribonuclease family, domain 1 [Oesophagostomum dentatum]|uniref:3' exoribonuclease family, domain 1 n=1 Tax=Oesophagostomum dentatum TaxID=61180 RepID=A0A0B1T606_OESDE|nr:3' exoribonuclease family, domain 1 [Oesophagostomum dentatum]